MKTDLIKKIITAMCVAVIVATFGAMLVGVLSFFISWYLACRKAGWRKLISIAAPLTIIQICVMYTHGLYNRFTGKGFIWKGRKIS